MWRYAVLAALSSPIGELCAQEPSALRAQLVVDTTLAPGSSHQYSFRLDHGASIAITVLQAGVDVVLEVRRSNDSVPETFDSPNGRNGPELLEIIATQPQHYLLTVRPYDANEPIGRYRLTVEQVRDARQTAALLNERRVAREDAARWLRARSATIPAITGITTASRIEPLDELATRARVIGLGEATHGSREFGDARLAITQRLIERHGYRLIAIEASATRLSENQHVEAGWIGRRTQRQLVEWVKSYNVRHPKDRVRVTGLDANDFAPSLPRLRDFVRSAYGEDAVSRWAPIEAELAAADSQAAVFGDSSVEPSIRTALLELVAVLHHDEPLLVRRIGPEARVAIRTAEILSQFADFNGGGAGGVVHHDRDWYMTANLLRSLEGVGAAPKAVFWAHNAHVAKAGPRTTGGLLSAVLGCDYAAIALTFGEGAFVAQVPNDVDDRLTVSSLPRGPEETVESIMAHVGPGIQWAAWPCGTSAATAWLQAPQRMHWVGALFSPRTPPSEAYRPFDLPTNFDGLLYIPEVTADDVFTDRPRVPPRRRGLRRRGLRRSGHRAPSEAMRDPSTNPQPTPPLPPAPQRPSVRGVQGDLAPARRHAAIATAIPPTTIRHADQSRSKLNQARCSSRSPR